MVDTKHLQGPDGLHQCVIQISLGNLGIHESGVSLIVVKVVQMHCLHLVPRSMFAEFYFTFSY